MSFGANFAALPRQAVMAKATPPSGASQEAIWHAVYDTQTFASASTTTLTFFSAVNADKTLSNMEASGQFPSPQSFQIYNICLDAWTPLAVSTSATVTGNLNDLGLIMQTGRPTWTLTLSSKAYGPYPLTALHATGGASGFGFSSDGAEILQYARNEPSPGWNYFGKIIIPEQVAFNFRLDWAAAQTITASWLLRLTMMGVLNRRVV